MQLEQLVSKFQQKDVKAFEALYDMYSDSMLGVIYTIVKDENSAQEIMQDVFIKVWNNAASYSSKKGRFFTWILNIARNAAIDNIRSKAYKNAQKNLDVQLFVDSIATHENLNDKTDTIGIKEMVNKLAEKCKKIIDLLYFKGYTQKEASETLEIPLGTIKTRNRNCIKELRKMLNI